MIHFANAALFLTFVITLKVYAPALLALLALAWFGAIIAYEIGRLKGSW
tara:strand:- start:1006 stop:1152 length:147 start_codon:yes stop_codon:yes gene_type:complete